MIMTIKSPALEILAPAGSEAAFVAAVENGADAIYLGGKQFNARRFADNFTPEDIGRLARYAHIHGVRVFVTLNILLLDRELPQALAYAVEMALAGADALIVQDIGLASLLQGLFRDGGPEVHASTQMTLHNSWGMAFAQELGANRVVLAREVSLANVARIKTKTTMTLEAFGHGALCTAWSGQCLFSSLLGGRSGNRGQCAQPCRLPYTMGSETAYLLSTKDLCTIDFLDRLQAAGIASLKLEGRMKQPEYVAQVVRQYSGAVAALGTEAEAGSNNEVSANGVAGSGSGAGMAGAIADQGHRTRREALAKAFNRGFTSGYYLQPPGSHLLGRDKPNNRSLPDEVAQQEARESFRRPGCRRRLVLNLALTARVGRPLALTGWIKGRGIGPITLETAEVCQAADRQGAGEAWLRKQLDRFGDTFFQPVEIEIDTDAQALVPAARLNDLRRRLAIAMEEALLQPYRLPEAAAEAWQEKLALLDGAPWRQTRQSTATMAVPELTITVGTFAGLAAAVQAGIGRVYLDGSFFPNRRQGDGDALAKAADFCRSHGVQWVYILPRFIQEDRGAEIKEICLALQALEVSGFGAANPGALQMGRDWDLSMVLLDWPLNLWNSQALEYLSRYGTGTACLSPELTLTQMKETCSGAMAKEAVIHGRLPLMVLEHCLPGQLADGSCGQNTSQSGRRASCRGQGFFLQDRKGLDFPIHVDRDCRNWLLNSKTHCLIEHLFSLREAGLGLFRIEARTETPAWIGAVAAAYSRALAGMAAGENCKALGKTLREKLAPLAPQGFTTGHFFRGVE